MSIETGGPAFPVIRTTHRWEDKHSDYMQDTYSIGGMTLRDYFAAKALQGLLAGEMEIAIDPSQYCQSAYVYADAMIKERNKP